MSGRGPDAGTLLERALVASASAAGCPITVESRRSMPWYSATFAGERHEMAVRADAGAALVYWLETLPEAEFELRGHCVADLAVAGVADGGVIALEALTLIDA